MKTTALPLTRIGRSQAVCLPAALIRKHHFTSGLILEDRGYEIVLRSKDSPKKLSWAETYREMAAAKEDWSDWDGTLADGLDDTSEWAGLPPPTLPKALRVRKMKRYEIHWARLDPVLGSEIGKTRPCVIISDDQHNAALPTVVVCPLSSVIRPRWRTRIQITCAGRPADICAEQIRTLSKQRLSGRIGVLSASEATALRKLLTEMYGQP